MCSRLLIGRAIVSSYNNLDNCLLRRTLMRWAVLFTSHDGLRVKLVEDTINHTLRRFPVQDDEFAIDVELFATMRRVFLREFSIPSTRTDNLPARPEAGTMKNGQ